MRKRRLETDEMIIIELIAKEIMCLTVLSCFKVNFHFISLKLSSCRNYALGPVKVSNAIGNINIYKLFKG